MSTAAWKIALREAITDPQELLTVLNLPTDLLPQMQAATALFSLRVPRSFVARMQKGNVQDPLLLQVLPLGLETQVNPAFMTDPLQEKDAEAVPGLLHKYHGRVLLVPHGLCAVQCRYCFRRHFPYEDHTVGKQGWQNAFAYIEKDESLHELILSGGDPLALSDANLAYLAQGAAHIPHLKTLRFHSRIPVVLPERIDAEFLSIFEGIRLNKVMVLHCNHAAELDAAVGEALSALKHAGFTLLNQAVLLKGVNDTLEAQVALQHKLWEYGVLPYYLHLLDRTQGVAHFEVDLATAQRLIAAMQQQLPGYLVPKLAREIPGEGSKKTIGL
jgi:EF-P beta-lysylation protein EpmB